MADWISRLVIRGPAQDVAAFADAARADRARTRWRAGARDLQLSFNALLRLLPHRERAGLRPEEPFSVGVDERVDLGGGLAEQTYRLEPGAFEPDELLVRLSRRFPALCFVLGWVEPSSDDQGSKFIHDGHVRFYALSARRKNALRAGIDDDDDSDEAFWARVEADWKMMDEVIAHWDKVSRRVLGMTLRARRRTAPPTSSRKRVRRGQPSRRPIVQRRPGCR